MTKEEMIIYDMIVEYNLATPDELNLAFNIANSHGNASWKDIYNDIAYIRSAYSTIEEYFLEEEKE